MKTLIIAVLALTVGVVIYVVVPSKNSTHMTTKQRILKTFYPLIMKIGKQSGKDTTSSMHIKAPVDFYSLKVTLNDNTIFDFATTKGKKVIIVNTASDCGYTGQYEELEKLYQLKKDSLFIIGFPANDFGNQEKGTDEKIASFCKLNYGLTFPLAKKAVVIKNSQQQEVYKWLSDKKLNGWNDIAPTWNFCKYIIDEEGQLTHFYNSAVNPLGEEMRKGVGVLNSLSPLTPLQKKRGE